LQDTHDLSLILISHDVSVVAQVCRRTAVMYRGRIVEQGPTDDVLARPRHPYTKALIAAAPTLDMDVEAEIAPGPAAGNVEIADPGGGCPYRAACPIAVSACATWEPALHHVGDDHQVACLAVEPQVASNARDPR
jgi:oligopeptide/dipeptide ABC transporter ATP-binding protein